MSTHHPQSERIAECILLGICVGIYMSGALITEVGNGLVDVIGCIIAAFGVISIFATLKVASEGDARRNHERRSQRR